MHYVFDQKSTQAFKSFLNQTQSKNLNHNISEDFSIIQAETEFYLDNNLIDISFENQTQEL